MVSQLQFNRMGIEIDLFFKIRLVVFADVMIHERNGNHEGKIFLPVEIDDV